MNLKEIKAKPISDIVLVRDTNILLKDVEYDFKLDTEYFLYFIDVNYSNGKNLTVGVSEKFFNEHFSIVEKEKTLEEKYAKELAEVERLFPEGTKGVFRYYGTGDENLKCLRRGKLVIDEYNDIVRISTNQIFSGLLWSTKHGYSTPIVKEKTPLEICKEKYKEGMKIRSLIGDVVVLSENNVKKLYQNRGDVYTNNGDYLLYRSVDGRYTEILEEPTNKPTFGEKLVGKSFNPSKYSKVDKLKSLFAEITDIVNEHSEEMPTDILNKDFGIIQSSIYLGCLTEILKAQMLSVKFVTLSKD